LNTLAITSITNFILAGEALFLAGMLAQQNKSRFSSAWFWSGAILLLGLSALIGGIDHGFFENAGLPRTTIQHVNWTVLGMMSFFILMSVAIQFFSQKAQPFILIIGIVQFSAYVVTVWTVGSYLHVIVNYVLVMILLLVMNLMGLKNGSGSWVMIFGILILFIASALQILGIDVFNPLSRSGLYHVVSMPGLAFLYRGGRYLKKK
jgi:hypothetical protein